MNSTIWACESASSLKAVVGGSSDLVDISEAIEIFIACTLESELIVIALCR
jgi:hypothetical protein